MPIMKRTLTLLLLLVLATAALAATREALPSGEVTALGGPVRLVGFSPLCYPSPFSIVRNKEVAIQYNLSADADIDIYIYSSSGEIVKRLTVQSGEEGGKLAANKVRWDGISDLGRIVGNGIYMGTIISRAQQKVLGKFKLVAYN
jgi:hypothetical protein